MRLRKRVVLSIFSISMILLVLYYFFIFSNLSEQWSDFNNPMTLLAVTNTTSGKAGSLAYLYLDTSLGEGNIFIESYPLTKIDTQISTKLARDIACDYMKEDCSMTDFFYKIQAGSAIIGGPSAGAAMAVFTASRLADLELPESVAITGTISSSGLIGSVGGIPQKIAAASQTGIEKVLVPSHQIQYQSGNTTVDLESLGEELSVEVVGVKTLYEALDEFTQGTRQHKRLTSLINQKYHPKTPPVIVDPEYELIMQDIHDTLCSRTTDLISSINDSLQEYNRTIHYQHNGTGARYILQNITDTPLPDNLSLLISQLSVVLDQIGNTTITAQQLENQGRSYSSSSFCYSANVLLQERDFVFKTVRAQDPEQFLQNQYQALLEEYLLFSRETNALEKETISELEAYVIVKERLLDGFENMGLTLSDIQQIQQTYGVNISRFASNLSEQNQTRPFQSPAALARAHERLESAYNWITFHDMDSKKIPLDEQILEESCKKKISEVSELYQYLVSEFPLTLQDISGDIATLNDLLRAEQHDVCFFRGMHIKGRLNSVLNLLYNTNVTSLIEQNLNVADDIIIGQTNNNLFPILGYSYYEYAQTLQEQDDPSSALYYASIALEIANIDLYLQEKTSPFVFDVERFLNLLIGIIIGINIFLLVSQFIGTTEDEPHIQKRKRRKSYSSDTEQESTSQRKKRVPKVERIEIDK